MFLKLLNKDQRNALFGLAQKMIVADGIAADAEMAYLDRLFWETSSYGQPPDADLDHDIDLGIFSDSNAQMIVGVELLIIAVVDGEFHPAEAAFANRIIDQLGISEAQHQELYHVAEKAADALTAMDNLLD